jgi:hypothetical protein
VHDVTRGQWVILTLCKERIGAIQGKTVCALCVCVGGGQAGTGGMLTGRSGGETRKHKVYSSMWEFM